MRKAPNRKLISLILLAVMATSSLPVFSLAQQQQAPLFSITLIAPGNANLVRRQWGQIIANALQQVGIDAKIVFLGWGPVFDRAILPARENVGKSYADGGYDALFIGQTPAYVPNQLAPYYGGDPRFFAPDGLNFQLYDNATSNSILEQYVTTASESERERLYKEWQAVVFDDLPESEILYEQFVIAVNPAISGYGWTYFNVGPTPQWLTGKESVTFASTGELLTYLPDLSQSWYDAIAFQPMYDQMAMWAPDYPKRIALPSALQSWSSSEDGRVSTLNVRPGMKWHDDVPVTADDILWTFYMNINPEGGSAQVGITSGVLGTKVNFKWFNGTTTVFEMPGATEVREGTLEAVDANTVKVTVPNFGKTGKPYALFNPEFLVSNANPATGVVQPKHVYEQFPPAKWASLPTAAPGVEPVEYKVNGEVRTLKGPIGSGPYRFASWDPVTTVLHLTKNEAYWNGTALEAEGLFGVKDYYVKYIPGKESALAALKNGEVDLLDGNYFVHREKATIDPSWGKVYLVGNGRQYLAYNMRHPILGTGVDTPLGKQDPSRAAEAARYVRKAIDYLVPRDLIIRSLLDGDAVPGTTAALPDQVNYDFNIKPRPYDVQQALGYLALAGYKVQANPIPVQAGISSFILGMSTHIGGIFANPVTGQGYAGMVVVVQETKDNVTWRNVAVGQTDSQGKFDVVATPAITGTFWYRASFPGVTAAEAAFAGAAGPDYDYSKLPTVLPPSYSLESTKATVSSLQDALQPLATREQVTSLEDSIASLQAQLGQLTGVAYGAIAIAVVLGIAAILLARRKPT